MTRFRLSRRTLLRGAGVALGLPALECMLGESGDALAGGGEPLPLRYLLCFGGFSLRPDTGDAVRFVPEMTGPGYVPPRCLEAVSALDLAHEISVVSNLSIPRASEREPPPPQGYSEFHWHGSTLLCGATQRGLYDAGSDSPSSDQIVADAIGGDTAFRSLTYRTQALFYALSGGFDVPEDRDSPSFRDQGAGVTSVRPTVSPQLAWQNLTTGFVPPDEAAARAAERALQKRQSVLDLVDWRMSSVASRLSAADRRRLDQHWEHVRTLEQRLQAAPPDPRFIGCNPIPDPGADPELGGEFDGPTGYDANLGYSDEEARAEVFKDLIAMAVACDRTRVVAWMITMWQSFMNARPITGHQRNSHELQHWSTTPKVEDLVAWHVGQWCGLVDRLRRLPEGDGTVLDRCAVMLLNEGGTEDTPFGSHNSGGMAFLTAGGAGGLRRGEHVALPSGTHAARVPLTLMNAVGVETEQLGEVSGPLSELLS